MLYIFSKLKIIGAKKYCIIFLCLNFFGCDYSNRNELNDVLTLVPVDELQLDLDAQTSFFTPCLKEVTIDSVSWLYYLNNITNSIYRFNLSSNEVDILALDIYGPDGVGVIDGFDIISSDSLVTISNVNDVLSLIIFPFESKIVKSYQIVKKSINNDFSIYGSNNTSFPLVGGKIFFPSIPNIDPKSKIIHDYPYSLSSIRLDQETVDGYNIYTDKHYENWSYLHLLYSSTFNSISRKLIISHPNDQDLVVFDPMNFETTLINAKSAYIETIEPYKENQDDAEYFISQPHYGEILYDKYRKVYYRLAYQPNLSGIRNNDPDASSKFCSVIILSEKFDRLGEFQLPKHEFLTNMIFVSKEGLYINQPLILDREKGIFSEDILRFVRFRLDSIR
jgi:hypothetical protein